MAEATLISNTSRTRPLDSSHTKSNHVDDASPPPSPYLTDTSPLAPHLGGYRWVACSPRLPPSHPPRTHPRPRPRSRRLLRPQWRPWRRLQRPRPRRHPAPRLDRPPRPPQWHLGPPL